MDLKDFVEFSDQLKKVATELKDFREGLGKGGGDYVTSDQLERRLAEMKPNDTYKTIFYTVLGVFTFVALWDWIFN